MVSSMEKPVGKTPIPGPSSIPPSPPPATKPKFLDRLNSMPLVKRVMEKSREMYTFAKGTHPLFQNALNLVEGYTLAAVKIGHTYAKPFNEEISKLDALAVRVLDKAITLYPDINEVEKVTSASKDIIRSARENAHIQASYMTRSAGKAAENAVLTGIDRGEMVFDNIPGRIFLNICDKLLNVSYIVAHRLLPKHQPVESGSCVVCGNQHRNEDVDQNLTLKRVLGRSADFLTRIGHGTSVAVYSTAATVTDNRLGRDLAEYSCQTTHRIRQQLKESGLALLRLLGFNVDKSSKTKPTAQTTK